LEEELSRPPPLSFPCIERLIGEASIPFLVLVADVMAALVMSAIS
jgi:hypothetical protein